MPGVSDAMRNDAGIGAPLCEGGAGRALVDQVMAEHRPERQPLPDRQMGMLVSPRQDEEHAGLPSLAVLPPAVPNVADESGTTSATDATSAADITAAMDASSADSAADPAGYRSMASGKQGVFPSPPVTDAAAPTAGGKAKPKKVWDSSRYMCEHKRRKYLCRECGGSQICPHNKIKTSCKECKQASAKGAGGSICDHGRRRAFCKDCGGGAVCVHKRQKSTCKECGGSQICPHNRVRSCCKECKGGSICPHNRVRTVCKLCKGGGICVHNRERRKCKDCIQAREDAGVASDGRPVAAREAGKSPDATKAPAPAWWPLPASKGLEVTMSSSGGSSAQLAALMESGKAEDEDMLASAVAAAEAEAAKAADAATAKAQEAAAMAANAAALRSHLAHVQQQQHLMHAQQPKKPATAPPSPNKGAAADAGVVGSSVPLPAHPLDSAVLPPPPPLHDIGAAALPAPPASDDAASKGLDLSKPPPTWWPLPVAGKGNDKRARP